MKNGSQVGVEDVPISTLLSWVLVAFTIEFDNESERRIQHWTTMQGRGSSKGVWLTSQVMWANIMQYLPKEGISLGELREVARTDQNSMRGLERWGYVALKEPPAGGKKVKPSDFIVRPTQKGQKAQAIWAPLSEEIEERWRIRFSAERVGSLKSELRDLLEQLDLDLPEYLPVVGYGFRTETFPDKARPFDERGLEVMGFSGLVSRVLMAFTLEFERHSKVSLAMAANSLRVLGNDDVRLRDLTELTGVSKEGLAMATGFLERTDRAVIATEGASKVIRLTESGLEAKENYLSLLVAIEQRWRKSFGEDSIARIRLLLEEIVNGPIMEGIKPYPDGWRTQLKAPKTLPWHPLVLHRGGYPDGS